MDIEKEIESLTRIFHRLSSTAEDKLEGVLAVLIPKLIPMVDNPQLETSVMQIISLVLTRIKDWKVTIPIELLICFIHRVDGNKIPVSSNVAINLIDASIANYPQSKYSLCIVPLMESLVSFQVFSSQSNSLCNYAITLFPALCSVDKHATHNINYSTAQHSPLEILGDWFLDISLIQGELSRSGVGSVQPGLSVTRANRLTATTESWSTAQLKSFKFDLISALSHAWLPAGHCVAICIACSMDIGNEVLATQATYRVNGARSLFRLHEQSDSVWMTLLGLCSLTTNLNPQNCRDDASRALLASCRHYDNMLVNRERSAIREELHANILHFLKKELITSVPLSSLSMIHIVSFFVREMLLKFVSHSGGSDSTTPAVESFKCLAASSQLLAAFHEITANKCREVLHFRASANGVSSFISLEKQREYFSSTISIPTVLARFCDEAKLDGQSPIDIFLSVSRICLEICYVLFDYMTSRHAVSNMNSSHMGTVLHSLCSVVDSTLLLAPAVVLSCPKVVIGLLRLLSQQNQELSASAESLAADNKSKHAVINEKEGKFVASEKGKSHIHYDVATILLGSLGAIRQQFQHLVESGHNASTIVSPDESVRSVLLQCLSSSNAKCRLMAARYIRVLFGWNPFSLHTILLLVMDSVDFVSDTAAEELMHLQNMLEKGAISAEEAATSDLQEEHETQFQGDLRLLQQLASSSNSQTHDELCTAILQAIPTHMPDCMAPTGMINSKPIRAVVLLLQCARTAIRASRSSQGFYCHQPYVALDEELDVAPRLLTQSAPSRNWLASDADTLSVFSSFSRIRMNEAGANLLLQQATSFIFDALAIRASDRSGSAVQLETKVIFRVHNAVFWRTCREMLTPMLLSWLSETGDVVAIQKISQTLGLLCLRSSHEAVAAVAVSSSDNEDLDYVTRLVRVLKLKIQEESSRPHREGGGLFALTSVIDVLIHAFSNDLVTGVDATSLNAVQWRKLTQSVLDSWSSIVLSFLNTELVTGSHAVTSSLHVVGRLFFSLRGIQSACIQHVSCSLVDQIDPDPEVRKRKIGDVLASIQLVANEKPVASFQIATTVIKDMLIYRLHIDKSAENAKANISVLHAAIEAVAKAASFGDNADFQMNVVRRLLSSELWNNVNSIQGRFCIAESIATVLGAFSSVLTMDEPLLNLLSRRCISGLQSDKIISCCILVVLSKRKLISAAGSYRWLIPNSHPHSVPLANDIKFSLCAAGIITSCQLLLLCLQEQNAFLQDLCCFGLSHIYNESLGFDENFNQLTNNSVPIMPVAQRVALEVIGTLTREKRSKAPVGVAVAGESAERSIDGDVARLLEAILQSREETNNNTGNNSNPDPDRDREPEENQNRNETLLPNRDELLAAASSAAAQLGLTPAELAEAARRAAPSSTANNQSSAAGSYGIYGVACKVAKKAGDPAIVFSVIAAIQRDPSFSTPTNNENYELYLRYVPGELDIPLSRLHDILPMLYLSKFDFNQAIREVMKGLWQSLVTVKRREYLTRTMQPQIVTYLVKHMTSKLWRERLAAATSIEYMFTHQLTESWKTTETYLEQIWDGGFYMLDDIRDECRIAAMQLMKSVAENVIRYCDSSLVAVYNEDIAKQVIEFVIPKMLDRGLVASAVEAKGFALGILSRVVKLSRRLLGEFRPKLVSVLIECMSAFEPRMLQYMQFHTSRLSMTDEELERIRVRLATESPMQEALDVCLQSLDANSVAEAVRAINLQITAGVGLASRVAAVKALNVVAEAFGDRVGEVCKPIFRILVATTLASGKAAITLRQALIGVVGSLAKIIELPVLESVTVELLDRYKSTAVSACDEELAFVIASCIKQIVSRAGDRFEDRTLWVAILACSYIGSFELEPQSVSLLARSGGDAEEEAGASSASSRSMWASTWVDALVGSETGTKTSALQRALPTISFTLCAMLDDLSWVRRQQAIRVINDLTTSLLPQQLAPNIGQVIVFLIRNIQSHIWLGQSDVLTCLSGLLVHCSHRIVRHQPGSSHIIMVRDQAVVSLEQFPQFRMIRSGDAVTDGGADETSQNSDAFCFDLMSCGGNFRQQLESMSTWAVAGDHLMQLLLVEASRGTSEYRLMAAKAIAGLPFQQIFFAATIRDGGVPIVGSTNLADQRVDVELLCTLIERICVLLGLNPTCKRRLHKQLEIVLTVPVVQSAVPAISPPSGTNLPSTIAPKPVPVKNIATTAAKGAATKKSFEMFGNRYSSSIPVTGPKSSPSVTRPVVTKAGPSLMNRTSDTSRSSMESNAIASEPSLVSTAATAPGFLLDLHKFLSENESSKTDPAYRMQLIECLCSIWEATQPTAAAAFQSPIRLDEDEIAGDSQSKLAALHIELMMWCTSNALHEVWSIRRACLRLLVELLISACNSEFTAIEVVGVSGSSLISSRTARDGFVEWVLESLLRGIQDKKYSKLKLAALQSFHKLLSNAPVLSLIENSPHSNRLLHSILNLLEITPLAAASSVSPPVGLSSVSGTGESDTHIVETISKIRTTWNSRNG